MLQVVASLTIIILMTLEELFIIVIFLDYKPLNALKDVLNFIECLSGCFSYWFFFVNFQSIELLNYSKMSFLV
jgi:hypothetical protein